MPKTKLRDLPIGSWVSARLEDDTYICLEIVGGALLRPDGKREQPALVVRTDLTRQGAQVACDAANLRLRDRTQHS